MSILMNIRNFLFVALSIVPSLAFASQTFIIYMDPQQMGDKNLALGVFEAYHHLEPEAKKLEFAITDQDKLKAAVEEAVRHDKKKPIVLAVGEKTVVPFAELLPLNKATTIHAGHMASKDHDKLLDRADYVALPVHAISNIVYDPAKAHAKLIKTVGVAHNRQISTVEKEYRDNKDKLPQNRKFWGIILGGDAPTADGQIKLFTEENARQLARFVATHRHNRYLLITNGPRTGKFDPESMQENTSVHRNGATDHVTMAFLDELEQKQVKPDSYRLFDFQHGKSSYDMDLIFGAIRSQHAAMVVPGESTSSISECIDVLPAGAVVIYEDTSMNDIHHAHVKSEFEAGRIHWLVMDYTKQLDSRGIHQLSKKSAAEIIAEALVMATKGK